MSIKIGTKDGNWKINGTDIYTPSIDTQIKHTNVVADGSGRTQDGKMHIIWVRRDIRQVQLKWNYLTGNQVKEIENLMQGKEFTLTYYDFGEKHTLSGYAGESNYSIYTYGIYADQGGLYKDFSINVEEM